MRSVGYSALLGWLVHFILHSSARNQTESQAGTAYGCQEETVMVFSKVSWTHDLDTSSSLVRILGDTQHSVVLILDDGSGTQKDLDGEYW